MRLCGRRYAGARRPSDEPDGTGGRLKGISRAHTAGRALDGTSGPWLSRVRGRTERILVTPHRGCCSPLHLVAVGLAGLDQELHVVHVIRQVKVSGVGRRGRASPCHVPARWGVKVADAGQSLRLRAGTPATFAHEDCLWGGFGRRLLVCDERDDHHARRGVLQVDLLRDAHGQAVPGMVPGTTKFSRPRGG